MLSLIISLTFIFNVISTNTVPIATSAYVTPEGTLYDPSLAVTTTVYGRTMTIDPNSHQRIIDVAGKVDLTTGVMPISVVFSSAYGAEATDDGIAAFDFNTNQVSFVSNGIFGGAVFTADMKAETILPPSSFYLDPVDYLGYDGVTQRRIIAGQNTPGSNFIIFEKPNYGDITVVPIPNNFPLTANDAYDGKTGNYYVTRGASILIWNIEQNTTTSFTLACIPPNTFLTGSIFVNPLDSNIIFGVLDAGDNYTLITINLSGKNCMVVGDLPMLPPTPRIIIATEVGHISGNLAISVTSDDYSAIIIYDQTLKLVTQVKTAYVIEDIFISEMSS